MTIARSSAVRFFSALLGGASSPSRCSCSALGDRRHDDDRRAAGAARPARRNAARRRARPDPARHLRARRARRRVHHVDDRAEARIAVRPVRPRSSSRAQATGSGIVIDDDGHDPHELPRRRERRSRSRSASRQARPSSAKIVGKDPLERPRGAAGRARRPDARPLTLGDSSDGAGRRPGARDRQPVRPRPHAHDRRRLGAAAPDHRARTASRSTT